ncbi:MAG TPA: hypothetical protein VJI12_03695 [archaeon]|nr:hypothetical protein [archaeon]
MADIELPRCRQDALYFSVDETTMRNLGAAVYRKISQEPGAFADSIDPNPLLYTRFETEILEIDRLMRETHPEVYSSQDLTDRAADWVFDGYLHAALEDPANTAYKDLIDDLLKPSG